nr:MAG TPA: hypothetical protein [Caudoviricetes sp.]
MILKAKQRFLTKVYVKIWRFRRHLSDFNT